ncbi:MAG: peptide-methionine (S)-S-oxide reductase, partial [Thiobacillaceae bacterium]|nr:peptide-methionine (S)-S-oxide reductase [Thiobacillaceae bacterium]
MLHARTMKALLLSLSLAVLLGACARDSTSAPAAAKTPDPNVQVDSIVLGMGCFWGAERRMAALPGVVDVESGYANGEI